jgi:DNA replication protein DnaC
MEKIQATLKKIDGNTLKGSTRNLSTMSEKDKTHFELDVCPICHGIGFVRQDLPVGHPDFGKLIPCSCRVSHQKAKEIPGTSNLNRLSDYAAKTFDNFSTKGRMGLGDEQEKSLTVARSHAEQFAQDIKGWLLFCGGYGCGKTHLAAAIANHVSGLGIATLFLTVPDLLDSLRASFGSTEDPYADRFEEIRNVHVLVLDNLWTQNASPWALEKLFQLIDHRYIKRLPTVITTDKDLEELDGRIRSRLQDPELATVLKINAPDYRQPVQQDNQPHRSVLSLLHTCTFGNFSLRELEKLSVEELRSLSAAFQKAQTFANQPHGWLVFMGPYGCGKTHLAAAIGNYRASQGFPVDYWVVPDLLDHLRATFSPTSSVTYDREFEDVKTSPLLILDDLGTQVPSAWVKEKLYQLFNYRSIANLPTVITTSDRLEEIDSRLRTRMLDKRLCTIQAVTAPPFIKSVTAGSTVIKRLKKSGFSG